MNGTGNYARTLRSFWERTAENIPASPLAANVKADVVVVGAGIAGMMTAYQLTKEGLNVLVLDDGPIGSGMTSRTTAHLVNALDDRFYDIESFHGEHGARLAAESHTAAIDQYEKISAEEEIACDFARVDGYLFAPPAALFRYSTRNSQRHIERG